MSLSTHSALTVLRCLGLPDLKPFMRDVYTSENLNSAACTMGPVIVLGAEFVKRATAEELNAVLTHERGHQELGHTRRMFLALLLPGRSREARMKQMEFEADAFAYAHGHSEGLISALKNYGGPDEGSKSHPSVKERISRLEQFGVEPGMPAVEMSDREAELMTVIDSHAVQGIHGR